MLVVDIRNLYQLKHLNKFNATTNFFIKMAACLPVETDFILWLPELCCTLDLNYEHQTKHL